MGLWSWFGFSELALKYRHSINYLIVFVMALLKINIWGLWGEWFTWWLVLIIRKLLSKALLYPKIRTSDSNSFNIWCSAWVRLRFDDCQYLDDNEQETLYNSTPGRNGRNLKKVIDCFSIYC